MTAAHTAAARLRGGFVGATSAAGAVAAHCAGGGALPTGATFVLLVLACATVAAAATTTRTGCGRISALTFVVAGQVVGHCVLSFASGHVHGGQWTLAMLSAHALAAVGCAVLICAAERLCAAALGELRRLMVVSLDVPEDDAPLSDRSASTTSFSPRILARSGLGTRAPPSLA